MKQKQTVRALTGLETKTFYAKIHAFRLSLNKKERLTFDAILRGNTPQEMGTRTGLPDANGRTKIDNKSIENKNGTIEHCPGGQTVQEGYIGNGNWAYYCG